MEFRFKSRHENRKIMLEEEMGQWEEEDGIGGPSVFVLFSLVNKENALGL